MRVDVCRRLSGSSSGSGLTPSFWAEVAEKFARVGNSYKKRDAKVQKNDPVSLEALRKEIDVMLDRKLTYDDILDCIAVRTQKLLATTTA